MTLLSLPRLRAEEEVVEFEPAAEPTVDAAVPADRPAGPAEHEIATEAYTRYLLRGCRDGHAVEDWLDAERSLREKYSTSPTHQ